MIKLTKLYQKTSKAGSMYFVGRLGEAKVVMLKSKQQDTGSDPVWNLLLDERQQVRQQQSRSQSPSEPAEPENSALQDERGQGLQLSSPISTNGTDLNDALPFAPEHR